MESKFYTGVGSRKVPKKIMDIMTRIAIKMDRMDYTLRSGGAKGSDKAFEKGATRKEIYYASDATPESMAIAAKYHGAWDSVGGYGRKLHGRNPFQVLGRDLNTPSRFVVCWTKDGCICHTSRSIATGGTGTALSIASEYNIPVYNLKRKDHLEKILKWLEK